MNPPDSQEELKQAGAHHAVGFLRNGMIVGLGHGSTATHAITRIGELLRLHELKDIVGIPCSRKAAAQAKACGIPISSLDEHPEIDITIDGADEVDPDLNMIKGGGGALLWEKIIAQASKRGVYVVDETKLSPVLGTRCPVPVEVIQSAWKISARYIETLGAKTSLRLASDGSPVTTDENHVILDCQFGAIGDLAGLDRGLKRRAGIIEHGLFVGLATDVVVGGKDGIRHLKPHA
jgi:ribose 5-phosphate isomerase A